MRLQEGRTLNTTKKKNTAAIIKKCWGVFDFFKSFFEMPLH